MLSLTEKTNNAGESLWGVWSKAGEISGFPSQFSLPVRLCFPLRGTSGSHISSALICATQLFTVLFSLCFEGGAFSKSCLWGWIPQRHNYLSSWLYLALLVPWLWEQRLTVWEDKRLTSHYPASCPRVLVVLWAPMRGPTPRRNEQRMGGILLSLSSWCLFCANNLHSGTFVLLQNTAQDSSSLLGLSP